MHHSQAIANGSSSPLHILVTVRPVGVLINKAYSFTVRNVLKNLQHDCRYLPRNIPNKEYHYIIHMNVAIRLKPIHFIREFLRDFIERCS